jgi:antitoxin VapB
VPTTPKVFTIGNSQTVRLPKASRLDTTEVWISRNSVTGVITLKPKNVDQRQRNIDELFRLIASSPSSEDFVPPRTFGESRDPFADEVALAPVPPKRRKS